MDGMSVFNQRTFLKCVWSRLVPGWQSWLKEPSRSSHCGCLRGRRNKDRTLTLFQCPNGGSCSAGAGKLKPLGRWEQRSGLTLQRSLSKQRGQGTP